MLNTIDDDTVVVVVDNDDDDDDDDWTLWKMTYEHFAILHQKMQKSRNRWFGSKKLSL